MAKKKAGAKKMQATAGVIRHARVELPDEEYQRLRRVAKANGLAIAAYIRMAILQRVRSDAEELEGGGK